MKKSDLRAYAVRDWAALADLKAAHWAKVKRKFGAGAALEVGEELRQHAIALRPEWPTRKDRRGDLATHARVAAALRSVSIKRR